MDILSHIKGSEALLILKDLVRENKELEERIKELAYTYLQGVEMEDVAEEVLDDLECLELEELWDEPGMTDHCCLEPKEFADEILAHTILHHMEEMNRYLNLNMGEEARDYCLGILKGLNQYQKESSSILKDLTLEGPRYYIKEILEEWKKREKDPYLLKSFDERLREEFPDWFKI